MVKSGDTSEPSCAEWALVLCVPPSTGATARVQMPHQHKILCRHCPHERVIQKSDSNRALTRQSTADGETKPTSLSMSGDQDQFVYNGERMKEPTSIGLSLGGCDDLYRYFCTSAMDSMNQPSIHMMMPRMSLAVPKDGG